jgi:hypothetical protein
VKENVVAAVVRNDETEALVFHHFFDRAVHRPEPSP